MPSLFRRNATFPRPATPTVQVQLDSILRTPTLVTRSSPPSDSDKPVTRVRFHLPNSRAPDPDQAVNNEESTPPALVSSRFSSISRDSSVDDILTPNHRSTASGFDFDIEPAQSDDASLSVPPSPTPNKGQTVVQLGHHSDDEQVQPVDAPSSSPSPPPPPIAKIGYPVPPPREWTGGREWPRHRGPMVTLNVRKWSSAYRRAMLEAEEAERIRLSEPTWVERLWESVRMFAQIFVVYMLLASLPNLWRFFLVGFQIDVFWWLRVSVAFAVAVLVSCGVIC